MPQETGTEERYDPEIFNKKITQFRTR